MNAAPTPSPVVSNPAAVMRMIETSPPTDGLTTLWSNRAKSPSPAGPRLRLHVDSDEANLNHETSEREKGDNPLFELDKPPTRQIEQLVNHLRKRQQELSQREADLQAEVYHWEQQVRSSKSHIRKRSAELAQHLSQTNQQQEQLAKLQQHLVDGQQTLRTIIERIVDDCEPSELKIELIKLRNELGERFDSIFNRWDRIASSWVDKNSSK